MELTESLNMGGWSNFNNQPSIPKEEYDDVFSFFPSQLPPFDLSGILGFNDGQFGIQERVVDQVPFSSELCLNDPNFYLPFDLPHHNKTLVPEGFFNNSERVCFDEFGSGLQLIRSEPQPQMQQEQQQILLLDYNINDATMNVDDKFAVQVDKRGIKRSFDEMEENTKNSKKLTRQMISQYFYMPITQAARELNVGLTLLKKRCRELGIRRWPHRKLMSLQTLIKNVQEFGKDEGEGKMQESLEILQQEKRLMEEIPDLQLEDKTKRLRQAFFKANYKKRKQMGMIESSSSTKTAASSTSRCNNKLALPPDEMDAANFYRSGEVDDGHEDEEFKYFFSDCFSSIPSF